MNVIKNLFKKISLIKFQEESLQNYNNPIYKGSIIPVGDVGNDMNGFVWIIHYYNKQQSKWDINSTGMSYNISDAQKQIYTFFDRNGLLE